jgi:hypothetical protein
VRLNGYQTHSLKPDEAGRLTKLFLSKEEGI